MILSRFDVTVISGYFPEFEQELPRYFAVLTASMERHRSSSGPSPLSMADVIRLCTDQDFEAILEVINDAAQAYKGTIPDDRFKDPYMAREELKREIERGVRFWGFEQDGRLVGVMGLQDVEDVTLIRHAYVRTSHRRRGIGGRLLNELRSKPARPLLVGTWAAAEWAIEFYRRHGFELVTRDQAPVLLRRYWSIPERQIETSVVLAEKAWLDRG